MATKKTEVRCPWCGQTIPADSVIVKHLKNDYGTVIERRCSRCNKVLAAYLEEEGEFLARMRTFY